MAINQHSTVKLVNLSIICLFAPFLLIGFKIIYKDYSLDSLKTPVFSSVLGYIPFLVVGFLHFLRTDGVGASVILALLANILLNLLITGAVASSINSAAFDSGQSFIAVFFLPFYGVIITAIGYGIGFLFELAARE